MDLRYLQSFVTVVDAGSLAEAARRLDLTPAAVSARVHALELELGAVLVKRAGRSVRPTQAGLKIIERARAVLRDARDLRAVAGDGALLGEFRLGAFASAMASVLPPVLHGLYARHPELSVFVAQGHSAELYRQVSSGELDAAIIVEPQFVVAKNCTWHALVEEPLVVVAPAAAAGRDAHELLRNEPFIRYIRTVLGGQLADRYLRDHDIRPRQRLEIDGLMAVAALVAQGLGVALVPDWQPLWHSGLEIARIALPGNPPLRRVGLVWARHGPRAALAQAFLEEAQSHFGSIGAARPLAKALVPDEAPAAPGAACPR